MLTLYIWIIIWSVLWNSTDGLDHLDEEINNLLSPNDKRKLLDKHKLE